MGAIQAGMLMGITRTVKASWPGRRRSTPITHSTLMSIGIFAINSCGKRTRSRVLEGGVVTARA